MVFGLEQMMVVVLDTLNDLARVEPSLLPTVRVMEEVKTERHNFCMMSQQRTEDTMARSGWFQPQNLALTPGGSSLKLPGLVPLLRPCSKMPWSWLHSRSQTHSSSPAGWWWRSRC